MNVRMLLRWLRVAWTRAIGCRSCPAITIVTWPRRSTRTVGLWREYFAATTAPPDFPFVRHRESVALIGVDTAVPTAPFLASGSVGAAQRERLVNAFSRRQRPPVVFASSCCITRRCSDGHSRRKRLSDAERRHRCVDDAWCGAGDSRTWPRRADRSAGGSERTDARSRGAVGVVPRSGAGWMESVSRFGRCG